MGKRLFSVSIILAVVLAALGSSAAVSETQSWPRRSVKFILPLGAGSATDIAARLFADRLSARWNKPVVIENRPGGDGLVAISAFVASHDEHTFLLTPTGSFTTHPFLRKALPYEPEDLIPIVQMANAIVTVAVPESLKVNSLADLVALARRQPGELNWASPTGITDFVFASFLKNAGLSMPKVPYRDFVQALNDLAEGRIQIMVSSFSIVRPQVEAGKVKIVALVSRERAPFLPNVPTAVEFGYPTLAYDGLVGLFGPKEITEDMRERIAADVRGVSNDTELGARLVDTGQVVRVGTSAEFAAAIDAQRLQAATLANELDIKPTQ